MRVNKIPSFPTRFWVKKPFDFVSIVAIIHTQNISHQSKTKPKNDAIKSNILFDQIAYTLCMT